MRLNHFFICICALTGLSAKRYRKQFMLDDAAMRNSALAGSLQLRVCSIDRSHPSGALVLHFQTQLAGFWIKIQMQHESLLDDFPIGVCVGSLIHFLTVLATTFPPE